MAEIPDKRTAEQKDSDLLSADEMAQASGGNSFLVNRLCSGCGKSIRCVPGSGGSGTLLCTECRKKRSGSS